MPELHDRVIERISLGRNYPAGPGNYYFPLEPLETTDIYNGTKRFGDVYNHGDDVYYTAYSSNVESGYYFHKMSETGIGKFYKGFNTYLYSKDFGDDLPTRGNSSDGSAANQKKIDNIKFNNDGTRLYFTSYGGAVDSYYERRGDWLYQYNLSTPYDVRTAILDTSIELHPNRAALCLAFSSDGSYIYTSLSTFNTSKQYIWYLKLSTPWDISTAGNKSYYNTYMNTQVHEIWTNQDGSQIYAYGYTSVYRRMTVGTPWDLSTATNRDTLNSAFFPAGLHSSMHFSNDGYKFYWDDNNISRQAVVALENPYDLSSWLNGSNSSARYGADITSTDIGNFTVSNNDSNLYKFYTSGPNQLTPYPFPDWGPPLQTEIQVYGHSTSNSYILRNENGVKDAVLGSSPSFARPVNFNWQYGDTASYYVASMPSAQSILTKSKLIGLSAGLGG